MRCKRKRGVKNDPKGFVSSHQKGVAIHHTEGDSRRTGFSSSLWHEMPLDVQVKVKRRRWIQESVQGQGKWGRAKP